MHRTWLTLTLLCLALAAGPARAEDDPFKMISVDDAAALVGSPGVVFLDANPADVYAKGHVPGAVFVEKPLAGKLPKDKAAKLVFYCKNPK